LSARQAKSLIRENIFRNLQNQLDDAQFPCALSNRTRPPARIMDKIAESVRTIINLLKLLAGRLSSVWGACEQAGGKGLRE
jgi:hypothetical protein